MLSSAQTTTTMDGLDCCHLWCLDHSDVCALLASTLQNIGALHHRNGRLEEALRSYGEAVNEWLEEHSNQQTGVDVGAEQQRADDKKRARLVEAVRIEARLLARGEHIVEHEEEQQRRGETYLDLRRSVILVGNGSFGVEDDARCSIAAALFNMGLLYHEFGHWENARSMYNDATNTLSGCCGSSSDLTAARSINDEARRRMKQVETRQRREHMANEAEDTVIDIVKQFSFQGNPAAAAA